MRLLGLVLLLLLLMDATRATSKKRGKKKGRDASVPLEEDNEASPAKESSGSEYLPGDDDAMDDTPRPGCGDGPTHAGSPPGSDAPLSRSATRVVRRRPQPVLNPLEIDDPVYSNSRGTPETPEHIGLRHLFMNIDPPNNELYSRQDPPPLMPDYAFEDQELGRTLHSRFIFDEEARAARYNMLMRIMALDLHRLECETNAHFVLLVGRPEGGENGHNHNLGRIITSRVIDASADFKALTARLLRHFKHKIHVVRQREYAQQVQLGQDDLEAHHARERARADARDAMHSSVDDMNTFASWLKSKADAAKKPERPKKRCRSESQAPSAGPSKRKRTQTPEPCPEPNADGVIDMTHLTSSPDVAPAAPAPGNADAGASAAALTTAAAPATPPTVPAAADAPSAAGSPDIIQPASKRLLRKNKGKEKAREPEPEPEPEDDHGQPSDASISRPASRLGLPEAYSAVMQISREATVIASSVPEEQEEWHVHQLQLGMAESLKSAAKETRAREQPVASTSRLDAGVNGEGSASSSTRIMRPAVDLRARIPEDVSSYLFGRVDEDYWLAFEQMWLSAPSRHFPRLLAELNETYGLDLSPLEQLVIATLLTRTPPSQPHSS